MASENKDPAVEALQARNKALSTEITDLEKGATRLEAAKAEKKRVESALATLTGTKTPRKPRSDTGKSRTRGTNGVIPEGEQATGGSEASP